MTRRPETEESSIEERSKDRHGAFILVLISPLGGTFSWWVAQDGQEFSEATPRRRSYSSPKPTRAVQKLMRESAAAKAIIAQK